MFVHGSYIDRGTAMQKVKLSNALAKSAEPAKGKQADIYWDIEVKGFGLRVQPTGRKSWFFQQNPWGSKTIGATSAVGVDQARRQAAQWKLQIDAKRENPFREIKERAAKERAELASAITLNEAWERFDQDVLVERTPAYRRSVNQEMQNYFLADFGRRAPADISAKELLAFRQKHEAERPYVMRHLKTYVSTFYDWMSEDPICRDAVGGFRPYFGKIRRRISVRTRKLTRATEIGAAYAALERLAPNAAALATQFLMLSNRRGKEVCEMRVEDVDFVAARFTFTSRKGHNVRQVTQPLTPTMLRIIKRALGNRDSGYVFSTTGGVKQVALGTKFNAKWIAEAGCQHISYHDLRRTVSTGMEELRIRRMVISLTAGHYDKGVEEHYQQAEKAPLDDMREAYLAWESFVVEAANAHSA